MRDPPSKIGQPSLCHLAARNRGVTLRCLAALLVAKWDLPLLLVIIFWHLSCQAFPSPSPAPTPLCTRPALPALIFITDFILPMKMDQIILHWAHLISMSRTATGNICT